MLELNRLLVLVMLLACCTGATAQQISKEELIFLTPEWKGERFPDDRPKVPDAVLNRMKLVTLEEAWAGLRNENFRLQCDEGGMTVNPDSVLVGRTDLSTLLNEHINDLLVPKEQFRS